MKPLTIGAGLLGVALCGFSFASGSEPTFLGGVILIAASTIVAAINDPPNN